MEHYFAYFGAVAFVVIGYGAARNAGIGKKARWIVPAVLAALFLGFSLVAVVSEGPTGFWAEHTRNAWGNQIWFDLLCAAGVGWVLILPRAKAQRMPLLPWFLLILFSGSFGLLAMVARLAYLESRNG
jgi:hypothetical protein